MQASIVIDNIQKWQNMKDGQPFEVIYLNSASGSYCAYPNTPGIGLVGAGKKVVVHYKTNNWQGKEYRNAYRITPAETVSSVSSVSPVSPISTHSAPPTRPLQPSHPSQPLQPSQQSPAQQMISLLTDIKSMMETLLQNQSSMISAAESLSVSVSGLSHASNGNNVNNGGDIPNIPNIPDMPNTSDAPQQSDSQSPRQSPRQAPYQDQEPDQDPFEVGDVLPF